MYLKPTGETNTYDVFLGEGWTNWSRVQINQDGTVTQLKGIPLNYHFLKHLQNAVSSIFYGDLRGRKRKE